MDNWVGSGMGWWRIDDMRGYLYTERSTENGSEVETPNVIGYFILFLFSFVVVWIKLVFNSMAVNIFIWKDWLNWILRAISILNWINQRLWRCSISDSYYTRVHQKFLMNYRSESNWIYFYFILFHYMGIGSINQIGFQFKGLSILWFERRDIIDF